MDRVDLSQKPRIHGDAVPSYADAWTQDVNARMCIGKFNYLDRVYSKGFRNHGEFIREGDVDVSVRVLHDLDKLSRHVICEEDFASYERSVG